MSSSPCRFCGAETRRYPCVSCNRSPPTEKISFDMGIVAGWEQAAAYVEANTGKRFGKPLAKNMRDHAAELRVRLRK